MFRNLLGDGVLLVKNLDFQASLLRDFISLSEGAPGDSETSNPGITLEETLL